VAGWLDPQTQSRDECFAGEARKILPTDGQRVGYEGATLVKMGAWYVLTCAE